MKKLLILLAFLPMLAWGQWSRNLYFNGTTRIITTDTCKYISLSDTIPVIMLVCDTACYQSPFNRFEFDEIDSLYHMKQTPCEQQNSGKVFWMRGYEVRIKTSDYYYSHDAYLDENKKPVKYLVWISKEVGK
jgi:hypothetical protein